MTADLAGRLGFEPRRAESESAILPLDDLPMAKWAFNTKSNQSAQPLNHVRNCLIKFAKLSCVLLTFVPSIEAAVSLRNKLGLITGFVAAG
jgi:hypothetical protein